jgi:hypothetical protein
MKHHSSSDSSTDVNDVGCHELEWIHSVFEEKNTNEKRRFRENLSFVQFRNFCILKSILKLIIRSLVNIKREKRNLFRWQKFKYFFTQFYFNLNYYSFHFLKFFEIYLLYLVVLFRQNDRF